MPAPNPNQGGAPHDSDDIQDLWYALDQLGFSQGYLGQSDYGFINSETLSADGTLSVTVKAPGGKNLNGQAVSTGQWSLTIEWLDENDNVVRSEGVVSNREADEWANFSLDPKSPFANIVIEEKSGSDQTADMTVHYK